MYTSGTIVPSNSWADVKTFCLIGLKVEGVVGVVGVVGVEGVVGVVGVVRVEGVVGVVLDFSSHFP